MGSHHDVVYRINKLKKFIGEFRRYLGKMHKGIIYQTNRLFQEASLELEEEGFGLVFGVLDLGGKEPVAELFELFEKN